MKNRYVVRVTGILCLGMFFLFSGGCGYKNPPVPPGSVVPEAIGDLLYQVDDNGVQLTWSYPVKTIKGSILDDVSSFELFRAEIPLEDYCGNCPIPFGEPMQVDGGSPFDGELRKKATYNSSLLRSGHKYFFKVRSRTSWWASSEDSNIITFVWFQPASAPEGLVSTVGDRQVTLQWLPVTTLSDGKAMDMGVKYQLFRSVGGKELVKLGEPTTKTNHVDRQVRNGQKYFYAVQSMMVYKDELVNGGMSTEVAASPVDLTPPVPPTGVTAVRTDVGMKIFWDKSEAADVGGYKVYRRAANKDSYELLGKVEPEYTIFVDRNGDESVRYYYAVTAIDQAKVPNESNKSREATVRY